MEAGRVQARQPALTALPGAASGHHDDGGHPGTFGGSGTTTYAENIGVMAATKVYSTAAYWVAAVFAIVLAFIPKFGAVIFTIPAGVLGGACLVLYGLIGMLGIRIWMDNGVDFNNPVNLVAAATAMIAAQPPTGPSSSLAIWPRERPPRRMEKNSTR